MAPGDTNVSGATCSEVSRVLFKDAEAFHKKREHIVSQGTQNLHLITDFDFTLSKFWVNGKRGASCHMVISDSGLMTKEYHVRAEELMAHYYPMEVDPSLSMEIREKAMADWTRKAHEAMAEAGMTKAKLSTAVSVANLELRPGHGELFRWAEKESVPFLLFSAGISDVLEEIVKQRGEAPLPKTCEVVSNRMTFDHDGNMTGFEEPLFHVFNKCASAAMERPYFQDEGVRRRENVLLVGDSLGDLNMVKGIGAREVLTIGFLNDKVEERLEAYLDAYDAVILGDGGLDFVLDILRDFARQ